MWRRRIRPKQLPTPPTELRHEAAASSLDAVKDSVVFDGGPKKVPMHSLFLTPVPITKDNLNVVIDAGWITKDEVCNGVKAGTVKACG